ncbi:MAG TPA: hypothetical protein DEA08_19170 [Planctomycetes bacterium]|nr:hypothetical protein [Planctomycetota bacterium]
MNRSRQSVWTQRSAQALLVCALLGLFLAGCGTSSRVPPTTGGGGGRPTGAPLNRTLPTPQRNQAGYAFASQSLSAVPGGEVSALGIAPAGTESLVAHAPAQDLLLVRGGVALTPAETTFPARAASLAPVGTRVLAATGEAGQAAGGDLYQRLETSPGAFTWSRVLDTDAEVAVVASTSGGAIAAVDTSNASGPQLYRYDSVSGQFSAGASFSFRPRAILELNGQVYVGGADASGQPHLEVVGAGARVYTLQAAATGERAEVCALIQVEDDQGLPLVAAALAVYDATSGAPLRGQILLLDGQVADPIGALNGDAPTALAWIDRALSIGSARGQLLFRDANGTLVAEPGFAAVDRVTSLLARGDTLLIGCGGSAGAELRIRTRR